MISSYGSASSIKPASSLLELVVPIPCIDGQGHSPHHKRYGHSSDKQHWVAGQHGYLGSQVASTQSLPLHGTVGLVGVCTPENAGGF